MTWVRFAIIAISSYLLGSLNFSIIISKLTLNQDIRDYGSGNAGLTNSYRVMGTSKTLGVLLGDIAKGAAAVTIGALLCGPIGKLTAGVFVIAGHMFPVYFGFRGGKGVLVGAVMLVLFDWRIFLIALALFLLAVISTRWISLGSVLGAASCPVTTWLFYRDPVLLAMVFGMAVAVVFMHRSNIMRMLQGTENKFVFQHKQPDGTNDRNGSANGGMNGGMNIGANVGINSGIKGKNPISPGNEIEAIGTDGEVLEAKPEQTRKE